MRLIDADKLIEDLKSSRYFIAGLRCNKSILAQTMTNYAESVNKTIDKQPTVYDVDKVVEQLEELKNIHYVRFDRYMKQGQKDLGKKHLIKFNAYNKAIEVVKDGGIDD